MGITLFNKSPKRVSIKSPKRFRNRVNDFKKGGVTEDERQSLEMAQQRAAAQLQRKNLSFNERRQFAEIVVFKIPPVTRRKK